MIAAFNDGATEGWDEIFAPGGEWRPMFTGGGPEGAVFHGPSGVADYVRLQSETWASIHVDTLAVHDLGDRVVTHVRLEATGRASGVRVQRSSWPVFEARHGMIASGRVFASGDEAFNAAGVGAPERRVRQLIDAFNRGDLDTGLAFLAPDVVWHDQRELPDAWIHHGHDDVRAHLLSVAEDMAGYRVEVRNAREMGGQMLMRAVISARGRGTGVPVQRDAVIVCTVAARQIQRVQIFHGEDEALHVIVT